MKVGIEIYQNKVCPVCKKTVNEIRTWAHCKKENGNVCMEHCYSGCEHLRGHKCMYLLENRQKN